MNPIQNITIMSSCLIELVTTVRTGWKDILMPYAIKHNTGFCDKYSSPDLRMFPEHQHIFNAFQHFEPSQLKVVIIGQDPYHTFDDKSNKPYANGLAFSVPDGCNIPPSLKNIFKEIERSFNKPRTQTDLSDWANQGVLLLNTSLTVHESLPASHVKMWKPFIQGVLAHIYDNTQNIVYMLWGNHAIQMGKHIDTQNNCVLTHTHPSPLSRKPFTGNNHFIMCNQYLSNNHKTPIIWVY